MLPVYNGARYLRQSIDSCLGQTYRDIELIIVDDGSTDDTPGIIKSYSDARIRRLRLDKNMGLPHALNSGFDAALGEYLTWTSADNFYLLRAIETMAGVLAGDRSVDFVYADFYQVDENGKITAARKMRSPRHLGIKNCVGTCFLYRRKVYSEIGDYNPEALLAEDYEYWFRVREKFRMKRIKRFLYCYRIHPDRLSAGYTTDDIEGLLNRVRYKYISGADKDYLASRWAFYHKPREEAGRLLKLSLPGNIFRMDVWRMLAIVYLHPSIVSAIRRLKSVI